MDVSYLRCMCVAYAACIDWILPLFRVEERDQDTLDDLPLDLPN